MNINLKQSLKKEVLQYMRDNEINLECVECIDLTKEEINRGIKEGSIGYMYDVYSFLLYGATFVKRPLLKYLIKINGENIPVKEIPE